MNENWTEYVKALGKQRQRYERELEISGIVSQIDRQAKRTESRLGDLIDAWNQLVPEHLASRSAIVGLRGGVGQVVADSASVRYELDQLLRTGLLNELRTCSNCTLTRLRIQVGSVE